MLKLGPTIWIFLSFVVNQVFSEIIRCYCNLPECIPTNYTCAYKTGGCFSDFLDYRDITQAKHGCLKLLDKEKQQLCGNAPGSTGAPRSLLLCCQADMCNHLLSPAAQISHTILGSLMNATEHQNQYNNQITTKTASYNSNDVWFKAATIAVPICGATILVMLIILAFKILRADNMSSNDNKYEMNVNMNSNCVNSNKVPLLFDATDNFRQYTAKRIHYGQNVNVLRVKTNCNDKNVVNERINAQLPVRSEAGSSLTPEDDNLDIRLNDNDSIVDLNFVKSGLPLNVCNLYKSSSCDSQFESKVQDKNDLACVIISDKL